MIDVSCMDRNAAELVSRSCEYCSGEGLCTVYSRHYTGMPTSPKLDQSGKPTHVVARTNAYCVCAIGRWVAMNQQKTSSAVYIRTPDLHNVIENRSYWQIEDPTRAAWAWLDGLIRWDNWREAIKALDKHLTEAPF